MSVRQLTLPRISVSLPDYGWFVAALVLVWGVGDAASTLLALELTGSVELEANPWIRLLLSKDPLLLPVFKAAVVTVAGGALLSFRPYVQRVPGWRGWFIAILALGSAIVFTNVYVGLVAVA